MEDALVDIFDSVEVITDDEVNNMSDTGLISIEDIINNKEEKNVAVEVPKEETVVETKDEVNLVKKKDTVLIIQIGLLIAWIILTVLIYFFGYELFEPFIKVSYK